LRAPPSSGKRGRKQVAAESGRINASFSTTRGTEKTPGKSFSSLKTTNIASTASSSNAPDNASSFFSTEDSFAFGFSSSGNGTSNQFSNFEVASSNSNNKHNNAHNHNQNSSSSNSNKSNSNSNNVSSPFGGLGSFFSDGTQTRAQALANPQPAQTQASRQTTEKKSSSDESGNSGSDSSSDSESDSSSDSSSGSSSSSSSGDSDEDDEKEDRVHTTNASSQSTSASNTTTTSSGSEEDKSSGSGTEKSKSNEQELTLDVLKLMKTGTPFLKYGKHGYPHFRVFQLSADNTFISWFSSQKKLKNSRVDIAGIQQLLIGQHTPTFHKHHAPALVSRSFSLVYNKGKSTLDVISKDVNEYRVWLAGIQELIKLQSDVAGLRDLKHIHKKIAVVRGRRTTLDYVDALTGQKVEDTPYTPAVTQGGRGSKLMYKKVAKDFKKLKKKAEKVFKHLNNKKFCMSTQWQSMTAMKDKIETSISTVSDWFGCGEYGMCDHEIWRAGVDLESLQGMMAAVSQQI